MLTATDAPNRPEDLPIWARLNLASQGVEFAEVTTWDYETATRIVAFLDNGRYVFLYRR